MNQNGLTEAEQQLAKQNYITLFMMSFESKEDNMINYVKSIMKDKKLNNHRKIDFIRVISQAYDGLNNKTQEKQGAS